ncbi:MauE/DoxX family redox-associated membrane protein [Peribacillus simplex]|uniref:MauE/DoxX family redox-associated membrane protein n=1 Tax=Peribacillus TaxID=2675229 RepID=UPI00366B401F
MIYLLFSIRLFMSLIFLSSLYTHIRDIQAFKKSIKAYKIISNDVLINVFSLILLLLELIIGIFLLFGFFSNIGSLLSVCILMLFNTAMVINLIKKNEDIDCGCGGIVGENKLSWNLVSRNTLFISISLFLLLNIHRDHYASLDFFLMSNSYIWDLNIITISLLVLGVFIVVLTSKYIKKIKNQLTEFGLKDK